MPQNSLTPSLHYDFRSIAKARIEDLSGNGHHARIVGDVQLVPDARFARCLKINGLRGHLEVPFSPALQPRSAFTIEAWLRRSRGWPHMSILQYPRRAGRDEEYEYGVQLVGGHIQTRVAGEYAGAIGHEPLRTTSWHHLAVTWDGATRCAFYYLDGEEVGRDETVVDEIPYGTANDLIIGCDAVGTEPFSGRLASLRLYGRALSADEIRTDLHRDELERFTFVDRHPIAFRLFDDLDENRLYVTDEESPGRNAHIVVANSTPFDIELSELQQERPTPEAHHFEVRFRSSALSLDAADAISVAEAGWTTAVVQSDPETVSMFFSCGAGMALRAGRRIALSLKYVKANSLGGARGSRVVMSFGNVHFRGEHYQLAGHRIEHVEIVNQSGRRHPLLRAGFAGSNLVMNDGETSNQLHLYLANGSKSEAIELRPHTDPAPTRFTITLDTGASKSFATVHANEAWAVATPGQVSAIVVVPDERTTDASDWIVHKESLGESAVWIFTLARGIELQAGEHVEFLVSNLVTSQPSGSANLYVGYENLPGHWDGEIVCSIQKAPRLLTGDDIKSGDKVPDTSRNEHGAAVLGPLKKANLALGGDRILARTDGSTTPLLLQPEGGGVAIHGGRSQVIFSDTTHVAYLEALQAFESAAEDQKEELEKKLKAAEDELRAQHAGQRAAGEARVGIGTAVPAAALHVDGEIQDKNGLVVPSGIIAMWSGSEDEIPLGWRLCDGTDGTPPLSGRFIVGYQRDDREYGTLSSIETEENTGGEDLVELEEKHLPAHKHTATTLASGDHTHQLEGSGAKGLAERKRRYPGQTTVDMFYGGGRNADKNEREFRGMTHTDVSAEHRHKVRVNNTGLNVRHENRPRFYVLAYIMKS